MLKPIYTFIIDEKLNQGLLPRRTLILVKVRGGSEVKIATQIGQAQRQIRRQTQRGLFLHVYSLNHTKCSHSDYSSQEMLTWV